MSLQTFDGFPKEVIDFLWELRFNNNKEWFDKNRDRYTELLKIPMNSFAGEMCDILKEKTGKTFIPAISRINRDIRFSKNKEPYKDHKWVVFKQEDGAWKDNPIVFFEIAPDYCMIGMGMYNILPAYMKAFRNKVDSNVSEFERLIKKYDNNKTFVLEGDKYKKINTDGKSEAVKNWYVRKSIAFLQRRDLDDYIYSRDILKVCTDEFIYLMPMLNYMLSVRAQANL